MVKSCWSVGPYGDAEYTLDGKDAVCADPPHNRATSLLCRAVVCECILATSHLHTDNDLPCTRYAEAP